MNKYQRRESRMIKRMHNDVDLIGMPFDFDHYKAFRRGIRKTAQMDAKYKVVRRNFRKMARILSKRNKQAHKDVIMGMDLANGRDQTAYLRQDLFDTIYIAKPIEVKNE